MSSARDAQDHRDDVDILVDQLRNVVERRRAEGEYPKDLEEDLDAHFRSLIPGHLEGADFSALLRELDLAADVGRHRIFLDSEARFGSAVHRTIGRLVVRQTESVLTQLREFATATRELLQAIVERLPDEDARDVGARVDLILDRLAIYERVPPEAGVYVRELGARLERVEQWMRAVSWHPWYSRDALAAARGADATYRAAIDAVVAGIPRGAAVLDISCGNGDALQALRSGGVEAVGVEHDSEMAAAARARGLDVEQGDGLQHLEARADATLDAVLLLRDAERLAPQRLADLVAMATLKLGPGGMLAVAASERPAMVAQTADAQPWIAWSPGVPAEFLQTLAETAGFAKVEVLRGSGAVSSLASDDATADPTLPAAVRATLHRLSERVAHLEARSEGYTLIATR